MSEKSATSGSIQTVVCATDLSETAALALEHGLRLARRHQARIVLAHVVEPIALDPYPVLMSMPSELETRAMAEKRVEEVARGIREQGLVAETRVEQGAPGAALVAIAADAAADVVVLGTRGLSGIEQLFLGSTAGHVVRRCGSPVLTIHPEDAVREEPIRNILVPTNLSAEAMACVDPFVALFPDGDERSALLTFADRTPPYLEPFRHDTLLDMGQRDVVKEKIEDRMLGPVSHLRKAGFEVETAVLDGEPVGVVTRLAEKRDVDCIVMTTHGRSAITNAIRGKIAQRIVQHAPCPVLTVRP